MAIPESQLETWTHQGAITTAKYTADSIRNALNSYNNWPDNIDYEVYLQGSYRNSTNVRGDSDVDVIAQLNSTFYSNLTELQKKELGLIPATYTMNDFKFDVLIALRNYYGQEKINESNKSIKLIPNSGRLPADIIPCCIYRKYRTLNKNNFIEGISFFTKHDNRQIINYPRIHYDNGVLKHQNSNYSYKPTIRLFKNLRTFIPGDTIPSYFLECLLYNVPNFKFTSNCQETFCDVVNWLDDSNLDNFICQNEQLNLFGNTPEQWNKLLTIDFIKKLIALWKNWEI
jgi:hypothetical protein